MITAEELKEKIRKKFGTLSKFARAAAVTSYELQKSLQRKDNFNEWVMFSELVDKLEVKKTEVSEEVREKLRAAIIKYGGVIKFCKDNPQFEKVSVFHTLQGRRKLMSKKTIELLTHFKLYKNDKRKNN